MQRSKLLRSQVMEHEVAFAVWGGHNPAYRPKLPRVLDPHFGTVLYGFSNCTINASIVQADAIQPMVSAYPILEVANDALIGTGDHDVIEHWIKAWIKMVTEYVRQYLVHRPSPMRGHSGRRNEQPPCRTLIIV